MLIFTEGLNINAYVISSNLESRIMCGLAQVITVSSTGLVSGVTGRLSVF